MPTQFVYRSGWVRPESERIYVTAEDSAFVDLDLDGSPELYIPQANWTGSGSRALPLLSFAFGEDFAITPRTPLDSLGAVITSEIAQDFIVRDFNGDGHDDLLIVDHGVEWGDVMDWEGGSCVLYLASEGGPVRTIPTADVSERAFWHSGASGDFDVDGDQDLVIVNLNTWMNGFQIGVFSNDGDGTFTLDTSLLPFSVAGGQTMGTRLPATVGAGDLDNDGFDDFVFGSGRDLWNTPPTSREIVVYWNDGTGLGETFTAIPFPDFTAQEGWDIYDVATDKLDVFDINGDGLLDITATFSFQNQDNRVAAIYIQGPNRTFTELELFSNNRPPSDYHWHISEGFEVADVNGDGLPDLHLLAIQTPELNQIADFTWINMGDGTYQSLLDLEPDLFSAPSSPWNFQWANWRDLNGDGQVELVALRDQLIVLELEIETISGSGVIDGSIFSDTISGGGGADQIDAGLGHDAVNAGGGSDQVLGGFGDDALGGGGGDDLLVGGAGADHLAGGAGLDTAGYAGSSAGVTVNLATGAASGGDAAGDVLSGIENLAGSGHADTLTGDAGANVLNGGSGDDTLIGGTGADTLIGGQGVDTARYSDATSGVKVYLNTGTGGAWAAGDTYSSIENVIGSNHADLLVGDGANNYLHGGGGADEVKGGAGNDQLLGAAGDDVLEGGDGNDNLAGGDNRDTLQGDAGDDVLNGGSGVDKLFAGSGVDHLIGGADNDKLNGGSDNDILDGGQGNDILTGGSGDDLFVFRGASGSDTITDFRAGAGLRDVISFSTSLFVNLADVKAHTTNDGLGNCVISKNGVVITLTGVTINQLVADDFEFVAAAPADLPGKTLEPLTLPELDPLDPLILPTGLDSKATPEDAPLVLPGSDAFVAEVPGQAFGARPALWRDDIDIRDYAWVV